MSEGDGLVLGIRPVCARTCCPKSHHYCKWNSCSCSCQGRERERGLSCKGDKEEEMNTSFGWSIEKMMKKQTVLDPSVQCGVCYFVLVLRSLCVAFRSLGRNCFFFSILQWSHRTFMK